MKTTGFRPFAWLAAGTLSLLISHTMPAADEAEKNLFNGRDLSGWEGNPELWSVKDGIIQGETTAEKPTQGNTFLIWKEGTPGDFELRAKFKIKGGNSGIQYRSKVLDEKKWVVGGYQADFEDGTTWPGTLYEEQGRGVLAKRGEKTVVDKDGKVNVIGATGKPDELLAAIKKGEWNEYTVVAQGNHLIHKINGVLMVDVTDEHEAKRAMTGILALQLHAGPPMQVQFKDITLKVLK